jgi:hypothetical protein
MLKTGYCKYTRPTVKEIVEITGSGISEKMHLGGLDLKVWNMPKADVD